jgi:hypothetical protein
LNDVEALDKYFLILPRLGNPATCRLQFTIEADFSYVQVSWTKVLQVVIALICAVCLYNYVPGLLNHSLDSALAIPKAFYKRLLCYSAATSFIF